MLKKLNHPGVDDGYIILICIFGALFQEVLKPLEFNPYIYWTTFAGCAIALSIAYFYAVIRYTR